MRNRKPKDDNNRVRQRYSRRNRLLSKLGYLGYRDYLKSDDWKRIRAEVMATDPLCILCERRAEVLHHSQYTVDVLLGLNNSRLAPLCHRCHERIEIDELGKKRSMSDANHILFAEATATASGMAWRTAYFGGCKKARNYVNAERVSKGKKPRPYIGKWGKKKPDPIKNVGFLPPAKCMENFEELWVK
jgi:hypothetical protein